MRGRESGFAGFTLTLWPTPCYKDFSKLGCARNCTISKRPGKTEAERNKQKGLVSGVWVMVRGKFGLTLVVAGLLAATAAAQAPASPNEIEVKNRPLLRDKAPQTPRDKDLQDVWVLRFRFNPPRLITVDIPGRGRKLCWYLLYHVSNPDPKTPHTFRPDFELRTFENRVYADEVLPTAQKAIQQIEDPTGHLNIHNSVTIANQPLPPTKPESSPRWATGVAIWDGVSPDTNAFSIFVTGLSNGYSVDDKEIVRRKTLRLNFRRLGDRTSQDARAIHFMPPEEWLYRATTLKANGPAKKSTNGQAAPAQPAASKSPPPMTTPSKR